MKRFLPLLLLAVCGIASAQTTTITASNIADVGGNPVTGQFCVQPAEQFVRGGGGNVVPTQVCYTVTAGVLQSGVTVADVSLGNPANVCYRVKILNSYSEPVASYPCMQPSGTTYSFDTFVQAAPPNIPAGFTVPIFSFNGTPVAIQNALNFTGSGVSYSNGTWTFSGGGGGGGGTVTNVSGATANGLAVTTSNPSTTPQITVAPAAGYYMPTTTDEGNWNGKQPALGYTPAHSGVNSDITSLAGLTTYLSTSQGGTGGIGAGYAYANGSSPMTYSTTIPYASITGGPAPLPTATAAGQAPVSTGAGTTYAAQQIIPFDATYTFWVSGGTVYARNESTGAVQFSNTDAAVVINDVLSAIGTTGGTLYFKNGIYDINSLTQESNSGCTNYYGVGIPANSYGTMVHFAFEGESRTAYVGETSGAIQNNGVIFYVTPTAVASVSGSAFIAGVWQRPQNAGSSCTLGTYTTQSNVDDFTNITTRFPTNTRGNEGGIIPWAASEFKYDGVLSDYNMTYTSIATGSAPAAGSIGLASAFATGSGNTEEFHNTYAVGSNIGYDIQSEEVTGYGMTAIYNNYPAEIGRSGTTIYHPILIGHFVDQENAHGILFGPQMNPGSRVDITSLDIEEGAANWYARSTPDLVETNVGNTAGVIHFAVILQGSGNVSGQTLFTTGGTNFSSLDSDPQIYRWSSTGNMPFGFTSSYPTAATEPMVNFIDNEPAISAGTRFMDFYEPNQKAGWFSEIAFGQSATPGNSLVMGYYHVGASDTCNSGFLGNGAGYPLTWNATNVGVGVALGTCPNYNLEVDGTTGFVASGGSLTSAPYKFLTTSALSSDMADFFSASLPNPGTNFISVGVANTTNNAGQLGFKNQGAGSASNFANFTIANSSYYNWAAFSNGGTEFGESTVATPPTQGIAVGTSGQFQVNGSGQALLPVTTPADTATCTKGQILGSDGSYLYICTATNTVGRVTISAY